MWSLNHMWPVQSPDNCCYQSQMSQPKTVCVGAERAEKTKSLGSRTNYHCESGLWPLKLVWDWKLR